MDGSIDVKDLVFVDEAGSKLGMSSDYARAQGGQRAEVKEPRNQGKNISLLGAMSLTGIVALMYCTCSVNSSVFLTFVKEFLCPHLKKGQIVIMDNINFHRTQAVSEAIKSVGASVVFLPPYSPELSPIENMWSKLKTYLKSKSPNTLGDYHQFLAEGLSTITDDDCEAWFDHCRYM